MGRHRRWEPKKPMVRLKTDFNKIMKFPLIANNKGDITLFDVAGQLEKYMEAIDVKNDEYVVWDADGYLIRPIVKKNRNREIIFLEPTDQQDHDRLKLTLIDFLSGVSDGNFATKTATFSLHQLLNSMSKFRYK